MTALSSSGERQNPGALPADEEWGTPEAAASDVYVLLLLHPREPRQPLAILSSIAFLDMMPASNQVESKIKWSKYLKS